MEERSKKETSKVLCLEFDNVPSGKFSLLLRKRKKEDRNSSNVELEKDGKS